MGKTSFNKILKLFLFLAVIIGTFISTNVANADNFLLFSSDRDGGGIYIMNIDAPSQIVRLTNYANDGGARWSPDGKKIAFTSNREGNIEIYVINSDGTGLIKLTDNPINPGNNFDPYWSPDGTKIAFRTDRDGNEEIYVMNADGTNPVNLTNNPARDGEPKWSPDGTKILFSSWRSGEALLYAMNADGSNQTPIPTAVPWIGCPTWSPDGTKIAYTGSGHVYVANADGSNPVNITNDSTRNWLASWSPDGKKLLFSSDRTGDYDIYTMNVDGSDVANLTNDSANDYASDWFPAAGSPINNPDTVAEWYMDEGSGNTINDVSGHNNNGTINGASWTEGLSGKGLYFDGINDYITLNGGIINGLTSGSIAFWFKPANRIDSTSDAQTIFTSARIGDNLQIALVLQGKTNNGLALFRKAAAYPSIETDLYSNKNVWEAGQWHHIAITWSGSNMSIYFNGKLDNFTNSAVVGILSGANLAVIGSAEAREAFFNGVIDEGAIYNRALTAEEINQLYQKYSSLKEPIIIVPGFMGSWWTTFKVIPNFGDLVLDNIRHTYDDLKNALINNGYVPGQTLFDFPYDWRFDNRLTAVALRDKISEIKSISKCQKVNVIAHSMGGLVVRYYIESKQYQNDIDHLILLGTPNEGAPKDYLAWEAGQLTPEKFGEERVMEIKLYLLSRLERFSNLFDYIRNKPIVPIKQLLPVYDYLRSATTGRLLTYPSGYPENVFLGDSDVDSGLNSPIGLAKLEQSGVKITNICGDNLKSNTIDYIRIINDQSFLPLWEDGYPEGFDSLFGDHGLELGGGDDTVPLVSAQAINLSNVEQIVINADHRDLPTAAFDELFKAITGESVAPIQPLSLVKNLLIIPVFSPVDLQVIDPLGRRIGKDFVTNQDINEIPLAYYTGFQNPEMEFVTIPNPVDGEYVIKTQGTGTGSYKVESTYVSDTTSATATFTANVQPGLMVDASFKFSSSDPGQSVITPTDTTPPFTDISLAGTSGNNNWFVSDVQVTLSAQDNQEGVGVFKTEYSLDNGSTWSTYTNPFSISKEGINSILYRSQDFVGNVEQPTSQQIKIDKTPPEAKIYFDKDNQALKIEGLDNLTSKPKITLSTVNASFNNNELKDIDDDIKAAGNEFGIQPSRPAGRNKKKMIYQIQDDAGHTLTLTFKKILDINHFAYAFLNSLQYDKNPIISLPKTRLKCFWSTDRHDNYNYLFQGVAVQNQFSIHSLYKRMQNETVISIKEKNKKKQRLTLPGLAIIKLTTKSGSLGYEF